MGQMEDELNKQHSDVIDRKVAPTSPTFFSDADPLYGSSPKSDETGDGDDEFFEADGFLEPFLHQVGGHGSVLSWDWRTVCKPYSWREHRFYEILPKEFKGFVPEYRGVVEVCLSEDDSGYLLLNAQAKIDQQNSNGQKKLKHLNGCLPSASIQKCESSGSLNKRFVGRIRLKRTGSLEVEMFDTVTNGESPVAHYRQRSRERSDSTSRGAADRLVAPPSDSATLRRTSPSFTIDGDGDPESLFALNPWALKCQTRQLDKMQRHIGEKQKFLLLENLVCNFKLPCILDLKMGFRQYGDDASQAKRDSQANKCRNTTSAVLGVRMCGMQVYHASSGVFKCYNKYYGRTLSVDGFNREICKFWHNGCTFRSDLLPLCIEKLKALNKLITKSDGFRFYSSSLLVIYEGEVKQSPLNANDIVVDNKNPCAKRDGVKIETATQNLCGSSPKSTKITPARVKSAPSLFGAKFSTLTNHNRTMGVARNSLTNHNRSSVSPLNDKDLIFSNSSSQDVKLDSACVPVNANRLLVPPTKNNRADSSPTICVSQSGSSSSLKPPIPSLLRDNSASGGGTIPANSQSASSSPLVDVRMIDFEHTTCPLFLSSYDDPPHSGVDTGYATGIQNLIDLLVSLQSLPPVDDCCATTIR